MTKGTVFLWNTVYIMKSNSWLSRTQLNRMNMNGSRSMITTMVWCRSRDTEVSNYGKKVQKVHIAANRTNSMTQLCKKACHTLKKHQPVSAASVRYPSLAAAAALASTIFLAISLVLRHGYSHTWKTIACHSFLAIHIIYSLELTR